MGTRPDPTADLGRHSAAPTSPPLLISWVAGTGLGPKLGRGRPKVPGAAVWTASQLAEVSTHHMPAAGQWDEHVAALMDQ